MRLPGHSRASRMLRRLFSRVRPGVAILGYHRVSSDGPDPLGLSVSPLHFEAQLAAIARLGEPISLADAVDSITRRRIPRGAVVMTFDDGYADNLHTVLPLLERYRIPATMFVTSGNRGGEFWWDRLARVHRGLEGSAADVGTLAVELEALPEIERDERLGQMERGAGDVGGPVHRTLTAPELQALAASPLIEIGAHTASHQPLPALPPSRQRLETRQSREHLESLIARPVTSFAYPHGAMTEETVAIVKEAGYLSACCSTFDVAATGAPLFELPRLWVNDLDGRHFERWLRRWLHGV